MFMVYLIYACVLLQEGKMSQLSMNKTLCNYVECLLLHHFIIDFFWEKNFV